MALLIWMGFILFFLIVIGDWCYFNFFRFLELESSGQRSEVRLHYRTKSHQDHTEVFPYSLADDQWHKVSVAVSASHVILHVDCNRYEFWDPSTGSCRDIRP